MEVVRREVELLKFSEQKLREDIRNLSFSAIKSKEGVSVQDYEKAKEISMVQREYSNKMLKLSKELNDEKGNLVGEVNNLHSKMGRLIELNKLEQKKILAELDQRNRDYEALKEEFEQLLEQKRFAEARLKSYRFKNREMTKEDDYTDKESFDELENELEVFIKFYKKEWNRTKRRIRKELLNIKNIRKHDDQI